MTDGLAILYCYECKTTAHLRTLEERGYPFCVSPGMGEGIGLIQRRNRW